MNQDKTRQTIQNNCSAFPFSFKKIHIKEIKSKIQIKIGYSSQSSKEIRQKTKNTNDKSILARYLDGYSSFILYTVYWLSGPYSQGLLFLAHGYIQKTGLTHRPCSKKNSFCMVSTQKDGKAFPPIIKLKRNQSEGCKPYNAHAQRTLRILFKTRAEKLSASK